MSYKDKYHPKIKTDLKKLDKPIVKEVFDTHIDKIILDPNSVGEALHGSFKGISSYHFTKSRVEYRIAVIGKRENFYEILRRRLSAR